MSVVNEMRSKVQKPRPAIGSGLLTALGTIVAFAGGGLAVFAWLSYGSPSPRTATASNGSAGQVEQPAVAGKSIAWSADRLGNAEAASVLRQCAATSSLGDLGAIGSVAFYRMIQFSQLSSGSSPDEAEGIVRQALLLNKLANCIYEQPARSLCDPANRALAVEVTIGLARGVSEANRITAKDAKARQNRDIISDGRHAMLQRLQERAWDGYLVAPDFGADAPASIRQVVGNASVAGDPC